jgi:hypothetical protein
MRRNKSTSTAINATDPAIAAAEMVETVEVVTVDIIYKSSSITLLKKV